MLTSLSKAAVAAMTLTAALPLSGSATLNVSVGTPIATQVILTYQAPDNNPCTIQVSENSSFSPLVDDVDPALFPGSNVDHRPGSIVNGATRIIVVGRRAAQRATDRAWHSRALQTNTVHYYRITCGTSQATGQFTTQNLPLGDTYPDPPPVDPTTPGGYAWPTFSATDRTEQVIDPQTGLLIRHATMPSDAAKGVAGWTATGNEEFCSPDPTKDASGNIGYHCILAHVLLFVSAKGMVPLGIIYANYNSSPDGWPAGPTGLGNMFAKGDPNTFYVQSGDWSKHTTILKFQYRGNNQPGSFTKPIPTCDTSRPPCIAMKNITPGSQGLDLLTQLHDFDSRSQSFLQVWPGPWVSSMQNGYILSAFMRSTQDTYAWLTALDPNTGRIVAARPTWQDLPSRWCTLHSINPMGLNSYNWMEFGANDLLNWDGHNTSGYESIVTGGSDALSPCPPNPFGVTGTQCSSITVDGEPCTLVPPSGDKREPTNPAKCGNPNSYYLQDAQPGDYFYVNHAKPNYELVRLLEMNGTSWTVQRKLDNNTGHLTTGTPLFAACSGRFIGHIPVNEICWDFIHDPHGHNANGNTVLLNHAITGGHGTYRFGKMVASMVMPNGTVGLRVFPGEMPDILTPSSSYTVVNNGLFGTVKRQLAGMVTDFHPNISVPGSPWVLDAHPYHGGASPSSDGQLISGSLYKFNSNAYGGSGKQVSLSPMQVPTLAWCNSKILLDVSGPNSQIGGDASFAYQYCVAKKPGECMGGSAVGDVYANCPNITIHRCVNAGWNGQDHSGVQDICIGDSEMITDHIEQTALQTSDNIGGTSRILTAGFNRYRREDAFWNVHGIPDGSGMMLHIPNFPDYGNIAGQILIAKLPPMPSPDNVARNNFIPIPVPVSVPSGLSGVDNAVVEFGYAENGDPSNYYCTSRREACVKGSQPGTDYAFVSDSTTAGVSCATSCTIIIPAVPQRMVYFRVDFRNAHNKLLGSSGSQVISSEPPFTFSSPGSLVGNLPPQR